MELGEEPFWEVEVNEVNLSKLEASYVEILENAKNIEHVHHGWLSDNHRPPEPRRVVIWCFYSVKMKDSLRIWWFQSLNGE